jgi:hypothetical protein
MKTARQKKDEPIDDEEVRGKPITLAPLNFEEALRDLLQVPPEKAKDKELAQPTKRATKKRAK